MQTSPTIQNNFIRFALNHKVLSFGKFVLKSGRISPYFFNAGLFNSGKVLSKLGDFYAQTLINSNLKPDMLFGPAYKGIPLAVSCANSLANNQQLDLPICFNRKETKDHGEGGNLVGAKLQGKVLIIDDVITAGTAIRETIPLIIASGATPCGILIALNRQEKFMDDVSAITKIEQDFNIPVISIINLDNLLTFLKDDAEFEQYLPKVQQYRAKYGA